MRKTLLFILLFLFELSIAYCQIEEWVYSFDGGFNGNDYALDLTVDTGGFIYTCGVSNSSNEWDGYLHADFYVAKISTGGDSIWSRRYNGTGNGIDKANSVEIDKEGNVLVGGYTWVDSTYQYDFCLFKYSDDGDLLWKRLYNTSVNNNDVAYDIALDTLGNCFITGYSYWLDTAINKNIADSILILKYNTFGDKVWARNYKGPGVILSSDIQLVVDYEQNVIVSGITADTIDCFVEGEDIITLKYSSLGDLIWEARYDNVSFGCGGGESSSGIVTDKMGNVYVTGESFGSYYRDYITIMYDKSGVEKWNRRFNGLNNNNDFSYGIALDNFGNILVTGTSNHLNYSDIVTIKYDSFGNEKWVASYNGSGSGSSDNVYDIAVNSAGYIYVTGYTETQNNSIDLIVLKYDSLGNEVWKSVYDGSSTSSGYELGSTIFIDKNDDVYVAGKLENLNSMEDIVVIKFDKTNTGIELTENDVNLIEVFPNPLSNEQLLTIIGLPPFTTITIVDNLGKKVLTTSTSMESRVSVNSLHSGMYFILSESEGRINYSKIIIQR